MWTGAPPAPAVVGAGASGGGRFTPEQADEVTAAIGAALAPG
jgi:hypothetical protein